MSHRVYKGWFLGSGVTTAMVVISTAFFAPACGQNAHVTRPNGSGSAVRPADAIVQTEDPTSEKAPAKELLVITPVGQSQAGQQADESGKSDTPAGIESSKTEEGKITDSRTVEKTEEHLSSQSSDGSTAVVQGEKGANGDQGAGGDAGQAGVAGNSGDAGVAGIQGEKGEEGVAGKDAPAVQVIASEPVVIQGPEGPMGPAGASTCGVQRRSMILIASGPKAQATYIGKNAMKRSFDDFAKSAVLPYKSTKQHKVSLLPVGGSNRIDAQSNVFVTDALTLMTFDVALPSAASTSIHRADLILSVRKLSADARTDTEVLCLTDERICSGKLFDVKGWTDLINKSYFTPETYTGPVNEAFSLALTDEMNRKYLGRAIWANDQLTMPLADLLAGSKMAGKVKELLYSGATDENSAAHRDLNVVVGDDTYVREAKLVLEYDEDTCISGKRN